MASNDLTNGMKDGKKNIVIVGASLAAHLTAIPLRRAGHNLTLLERSPALSHSTGAGIVVSPDLATYFKEHDCTRTALSVESPLRQYLDRSGGVIDREERSQWMTSWDLVYSVLRANVGFSGGYVGAVPRVEGEGEVRVRFGVGVLGVRSEQEKDGGGVVVKYQVDGRQEEERYDMLIAADGPSSTIRSLFCPEVKREYVGYCAWRGTVPEGSLSESAEEALVEKFTFFHGLGTQVLCYVIPGERGTVERGKRLVNWVWYRNAVSAEEKVRFLTDCEGVEHHVSVPVGRIDRGGFEEAKRVARDTLPWQFGEVVGKTGEPFVQAITDVIAPENVFLGGKVLVVGDALAGFRPHTAASTGQAAFDAMRLAEMMEGKMSLEQWSAVTIEYARRVQQSGVAMGERSQFGRHPLAR